jgi:hypothetical protein
MAHGIDAIVRMNTFPIVTAFAGNDEKSAAFDEFRAGYV